MKRIYRNEKNQAKHDKIIQEQFRLNQLAKDNGFSGFKSLSAGADSTYCYKGEEGLGFGSMGEARDHFLKNKGLI